MADLAEFTLPEIIVSLLRQATEDGMKTPFILCMISPNGSLTISRFTAPGAAPDVLAQRYEPGGFRLSMTIALIDQNNRMLQGEITARGELQLQ